MVFARYPDGSEQTALTCASCHARVEQGVLVHGKASDIDLGALLDGGERADGWGAGRIDVTADAVDNPVAIPDLRALRHQRRLHATGNVRNGLIELAIRIETLLITSGGETLRPPRHIVFALALYLWELGAPSSERKPQSAEGQAVFQTSCAGCHAGPTGEGDPVPATLVGTDPAVTRSSERGTGEYRVPSLWRVSERTRLTHEGRFENLSALFDPARLGHDTAHPFGLSLTAPELTALLDFLATR